MYGASPYSAAAAKTEKLRREEEERRQKQTPVEYVGHELLIALRSHSESVWSLLDVRGCVRFVKILSFPTILVVDCW